MITMTKDTLTINFCKMCLDMLDPLDDGIYIITKENVYEIIIMENHEYERYRYTKNKYTLDEVVNSIFNYTDSKESFEKDLNIGSL
jgi:hypothetical protein